MMSFGESTIASRTRVVWFAVLLFFVFSLFFLAAPAFAQGDTFGLEEVGQTVQLGDDDIRTIIAKIIRAVLGLLGIIVLGLILYGGTVIMTSGGAEDKVAQGKKIIVNAVIGLVIVLSALTITQFIINALSKATGTGLSGTDGGGGAPVFQTFSGSGSLGKIITDHYPDVGQTGVPRNAKIFVTFAEPFVPESFIENTNNTCWPKAGVTLPAGAVSVPIAQNNGADCATDAKGNAIPYYGDCLDIDGGGVTWAVECDALKTEVVEIFLSEQKDALPKPVFSAAALAVYDAKGLPYTAVFRPLDLLGNATEPELHTVRLTGAMQKQTANGATDMFEGQTYGEYLWEFETDTVADLAPPTVTSVYPKSGAVVPRNSTVRISFSEPMDPTVTQGSFDALGSFTHLLLDSAALHTTTTANPIVGEWRITNGYKTAEFFSSDPCGINSCGETVYCIPTNCAETDAACSISVTGLLRTAALLDAGGGFSALPFSGVMDAAGNALDFGSGGIADGLVHDGGNWLHKPPMPADLRTIGSVEQNPDNFWWNFSVQNTIDNTPPHIVTVIPGIDAQGVNANAPVQITFSKPMAYTSLKSAGIVEYPGGGVTGLDTLWFTHEMMDTEIGGSVLKIKHRIFGPNNLDLTYTPQVPQSVRDVNQNCFYPGFGPTTETKGESPICAVSFTKSGIVNPSQAPVNCVPVKYNAQFDTGCATTDGAISGRFADVPGCTSEIQSKSVTTIK